MPQFQTAYHGELQKEDWGLISVPQMAIYNGSVWACWDKDAPSFDEYMGGMKPFLDAVFDGLDGEPGGREVFGGVIKWIMPCQLEVRRRELHRRRLPRHQPPFGSAGADDASGQDSKCCRLWSEPRYERVVPPRAWSAQC